MGIKLFKIGLAVWIAIAGLHVHAQPASDKFTVAVAMPFCAKQLLAEPEHKNATIGNASREYYQGLLMALDSFRKSTVPIELLVYDTQRDSLQLLKILDKKEVQNADLILGPVLKEGSQVMVDFCKKYKVYHVSPFLTLTKSKIDNPYLISAYPDLNYYGDFMLDQVHAIHPDQANILVVAGKEPNEKLLAQRVMSLKSKYPGYQFKSVDIGKYTDLKNFYQLGRTNEIIITSENEFLVGSVLRHLADTSLFRDLEVFGTRKWLEFKTPNIPQFEQLNVRILTPYYMDYSLPGVKQFNEAYRERYFTEPTEFAVAGYEQGIFFVSNLVRFHGSLDSLSALDSMQPLSNLYRIRRKPDARSLQNEHLNLLLFREGVMVRQD